MAHHAAFPFSKPHAMPEPMNASSHHPKIRLSITPADPFFVAGTHVMGKLEMECRAEGEKGLGIGVVMIELFAVQELASRDHLATNTFLHSRRLFQGPGLPPSNAVLPHPLQPSQDLPPLPQHYFPARRGRSTFFFRIPLPGTCPSSIAFAQGQARVKYELRGSAGVFWKNERRLVICRKVVDVVERFAVEEAIVLDMQGGGMNLKLPEAVVVGESGKIWMQGRILGALVVAGGSACVELQVKNHSTKKNASLTLLLTRTLYLPMSSRSNTQSPPPVQISDTLVTVPFRGPEYIIPPGAEGVANLVFDVPKEARGVRGGMLDGEELEGENEGKLRVTESLFEIRCKVEVKLGMGMGSKDIRLEIPVDIIHPKAMPEEPFVDQNQIWIPPPLAYPYPYSIPPPIPSQPTGLGLTFGLGLPYMHSGANQIPLPISPPISPAPLSPPPQTAQSPVLSAYHNVSLPQQPYLHLPPRPLSTGPIAGASQLPQSMVSGFPAPEVSPIRPLPFPALGGSLPPLPSTHTADSTQYHSPRQVQPNQQQLSPIVDVYNRTTRLSTKSEHVEELEKIADVVLRRSGNDLSGDLPKGVVEKAEEELREQDREAREGAFVGVEKDASLQRNKTLSSPPPTVNGTLMLHETEPLPSDQTPPAPTLHALAMNSRGRDRDKEIRELFQDVRSETGLDALERRLLREVGTRKPAAPPRPDVRGVLQDMVASPLEPVKESELGATTGDRRKTVASGGASLPIPIPMKSPDPLNNDSAISSLTLAGRMMLEDMDDDQDSDGGRTHRAGSRSSVGRENDREESREMMIGDDSGARRHTRERAEVVANGRTPIKTPEKDDKDKAQPSLTKDKPVTQRKKDTRAKAKGRVAAWLGEIDVGVPPQEEIIPPSPSVVRGPDEISGLLDDDEKREEKKEQEVKMGGTAAPNPRSSGFVPIASTVNTTTALNRNTIHFSLGLGPSSKPLMISRDATVAEEARRVQALWDGGDDMSSLGYAPAQAKTREEATNTPMQAEPATMTSPEVGGGLNKFPLTFPSVARAQSIRTDRRVSPPSNAAKKQGMIGQQKKESSTQPIPMSYSAAAKNASKAVGVVDHHHPKKPSKPTTNAGWLSPPLSTPLDAEVKYDIRSARGGRGGKVTAVANLWASGAIMSQGASKASTPAANVKVVTGLENISETDREKGREVANKAVERRNADVGSLDGQQKIVSNPAVVRPKLGGGGDGTAFGVPAKTEKKLFSAALMSPPPASVKPFSIAKKPASLSSAVTSQPAGPSKHGEAQKRPPESRNIFTKPNPPPPLIRVTRNAAVKRPATATAISTPSRPGSGSQSPHLSQGGGRTTPMPALQTSLSTPTSPVQSKPEGPALKALGLKPKPGMIIPPLTNPASAVLSSSHAVPHLSSTASLARPHVSRTVLPRAAIVDPSNQAASPPPPRLFPTMLSTSRSAPLQAKASDTSLPAQKPQPPARVGSPSKLADLSFGQARLRDLIKKYQGQGA